MPDWHAYEPGSADGLALLCPLFMQVNRGHVAANLTVPASIPPALPWLLSGSTEQAAAASHRVRRGRCSGG